MRILIVKMSSLGDVVHALPAVMDAKQQIPEITFDWIVEPAFADLLQQHPAIDQVFSIPLRAWRKKWWRYQTFRAIFQFVQKIRVSSYDKIIDAQGLLKSALIARCARGSIVGAHRQAARESLASFFYTIKIKIDKHQHAITRTRHLFAKALQYPVPETIPDYGLHRSLEKTERVSKPYCVFLHGTTWASKHWPEAYWQSLALKIQALGWDIKLPWGNALEKQRATRIASNIECAEVLPKMSVSALMPVLGSAKGVVSVDTGLGHLTAALNVPSVSLYGPSCAKQVGAKGRYQAHLVSSVDCAPCFKRTCPLQRQICFEEHTPTQVVQALQALIS